MNRKQARRWLREQGYQLVRTNGGHELWGNGTQRVTLCSSGFEGCGRAWARLRANVLRGVKR